MIKGVSIKLDRERRLAYGFNALCAAEEVTGKNILSEDSFAMGNMSARDLRAFLWAGLIEDDPTVTLEDAGDFITDNFDNLEYISEKIGEAITLAMPESAQAESNPLPPKQPNASTSPSIGKS